MLIGLGIVIWSVGFLQSKNGPKVFLALFILLFLFGGGIGQIAFFVPAWAFATRLDKPLAWWKKALPRSSWSLLSGLWVVTLVMATVSIVLGIEIAIFGFIPGITGPVAIQDTAMLLVLVSAVLYITSCIAGFGHDLLRMERNKAYTFVEPVGHPGKSQSALLDIN